MSPRRRKDGRGGIVEIDVGKAVRFILGAAATLFGLVVAFILGQRVEIVCGTAQTQMHYDHVMLFIGVGIALLGMRAWGPGYSREARRYVEALARREPIRKSDQHRRADD